MTDFTRLQLADYNLARIDIDSCLSKQTRLYFLYLDNKAGLGSFAHHGHAGIVGLGGHPRGGGAGGPEGPQIGRAHV